MIGAGASALLDGNLPIRGLLERATGRLNASGVINSRLSAELLLARVLGVRRIDLILERGRLLTGREFAAFEAYIARRAARVPLQHLLGEAESVETNLLVRPGVF